MNHLYRRIAASLSFCLCLTQVTTTASLAANSAGGRGFDFLLGTWTTQISYLDTPAGSKPTWIHVAGTVTNRVLWDGSGDIEEIDAGSSVQGTTVRLYNAQSGQWSLYWANRADGMLEQPMVGAVSNGVGDFYDRDTIDGRSVLVHQRYLSTARDSYQFEQSVSRDGGRTWNDNFLAKLTRKQSGSDPAATPLPAAPASQHDFDWQFGSWKARMSQLLHPFTASTDRRQMIGTIRVEKLWNGAGNYALVDASGTKGAVHILALRLYLPHSRQWALRFSRSGLGSLSDPMFGEFSGGKGEFYGMEAVNGKTVLDRFAFYPQAASSARDEEYISADGGKTWQNVWLSKAERFARGLADIGY